MARYLVFGRTGYPDPLTKRGELEADGPGSVEELARAELGSDWVELALVPASAVHWILRAGEGARGETRASDR